MIQNSDFILKTINGSSYLFPTGQSIADHKRGLKLNDTGICIWKFLKTEHTSMEVVNHLLLRYGASGQEAETIKKETLSFLQKLVNGGMLLCDMAVPIGPDGLWHTLSIAGLTFSLYGESTFFSPALLPFATDTMFAFPDNAAPIKAADCGTSQQNVPDQTVLVLAGTPASAGNGRVLLHNKELIVMERADEYLFLFPDQPLLVEARLKKDASFFCIYCIPSEKGSLPDVLFHVLRLGFLYLAQQRGMTVLHSASLLYKNKAYLFSGPSGTGKSTHTRLWQEAFDTPLLNGDLNLLSFSENTPVVHGIPWCGTSGISTASSHPLGGIVFLKQDTSDFVEELPPDEQILSLTNRMITPSWMPALFEKNLFFAERLASRTLLCRLHCTPTNHAAKVMKEYADGWIRE